MTVQRTRGTDGIGELLDGSQEVVADIEFDEDDDDELFFDEDDDEYFYDDPYGYRALRPEWMHPDCVDPCAALEHGTCCKYPAALLVRRALDLADAVDQALRDFDNSDGDDGDCSRAADQLATLFECAPELVAQIRAAVPAAGKTVAAQLLCPIGRLSLLALELAGRSGCPWACDDHGVPDRRPLLTPLIPLLEDCDEALWATVLPKRRGRRGAALS